ncbi:MAG: protein-disulfide reductase DsbD domain-containing protein [Verrucomicrobiota bacterium]
MPNNERKPKHEVRTPNSIIRLLFSAFGIRHSFGIRFSGFGIFLCLALWLLPSASALAAPTLHTKASVILGADTVRPGDTVWAGIRLKMEEDWHTYWTNAGAAGGPTTVAWELPAGVTAGNIQWPLPEKQDTSGLITYGYKDEVCLLVPLNVAGQVPPGPLTLKATVSWVECVSPSSLSLVRPTASGTCVFGETSLSARLQVADQTKPSDHAATIEEWLKRVPKAASNLTVRAIWEGTATNKQRGLRLEWPTAPEVKVVDFYPYPIPDFEVQGTTEQLPASGGAQVFRKQITKQTSAWPASIPGILVAVTEQGTQGYEVTLHPTETTASVPRQPNATAADSAPVTSLWLILWFAFVGGLILNVMPCVLPVMALKILGFVHQSAESPGRVRTLGMIYGAGVMVSFLVLAGVTIGLKLAGESVSWGIQYQHAQFVLLMTVLVLLVALNLFGVFEVTLGDHVSDAASSVTSQGGYAGAFFNGVLATALATPCTAPFLGAATGYALNQSPGVILLVFLAVGLGMAAPYLLLSWNPGWLRFVPKPGVWMERFKQAMGFPMMATAVWLYLQLVEAYGNHRGLWLGIFLVLVALAAWIWGAFGQRGTARTGLAKTIAIGVVILAFALLVENRAQWRAVPEASSSSHQSSQPGGIEWQPWSVAAVAAARAQGHPVLVDFTASWCLTCQVNRETSLEIPEVVRKLKQLNAVALVEDSRVKSSEVATEMKRHGRGGVPLVLVYPRDPAQPPIILPEVLTPGIVLDALKKVE